DATLLRAGDSSLRAARRAHAGRCPRQLAARVDHGIGEAVTGRHLEARTRDRRSHHLSPERRCDRGVEARFGGVSENAEIISLTAPVGERALDELADVLSDCVAGGASVYSMASFP